MKRWPLLLKFWLKRCSHEGCWHKGDPYSIEGDRPDEYVCAEHAHAAGYCSGCGQFLSGIESFDFSRSGLCSECDWSARNDSGEFDEYEEEPWNFSPEP